MTEAVIRIEGVTLQKRPQLTSRNKLFSLLLNN